jgi:hypothetical protein
LVRAVWTSEFDGAPILPIATALMPGARRDAVGLTSEFGLLDPVNISFLSEEDRRELELLERKVAVPIRVRRLELGPLGGTLDLRHDFPVIDLSGFLGFFDDLALSGLTEFFSLRHWTHRTRLGRDLHVRTATAGHLFPYGHRALRIDIAERVIDQLAWLIVRTMIVVDEEERRYPAGDFPFQTVRFPTDTSVKVPTPPPDRLPFFSLQASATDRAGAVHTFPARLLFVAGNAAPGDFNAYAREDRDAPLPGTPLAFLAAAGGSLPATGLRVAARPGAGPGGAVPFLEQAVVVSEAAAAFAGTGREVAIRYTREVAEGAIPDQFATLVAPLAARVSAARSGGMAAPAFALDALSRANGLTIAVPSDPQALLRSAISGRLLGFLEFADVVDLAGADAVAVALPVFRTIAEGGAPRIEFSWSPNLLLPGASLSLSGTVRRDGDRPSVSMRGELRNFMLDFAGLVSFGFDRLVFTSETGQAPAIESVAGRFTFRGDLAFLSRIADALAATAPGGAGARVAMLPDGIEARMRVALPDLGMGQFTLIHLALESALSLRFSAPAQISLGLGSRQAPVLVSYNGLGGGGYLTLVSDLDAAVSLEAAIEFGAVVAIDLVILRASAQIVAGIFIRLDRSEDRATAVLGGYVRAHGAVEIFGIATVALDVMLSLSLEGQVVRGTAIVTILVRLFAFSRSVSFRFSQSFDADAVLPGEGVASARLAARQTTPLHPDDWAAYCAAFA